MFGFLVGTLSLVGLVRMWRWGRWQRYGGARRWMMRRLFERLDTSPGQEKVMAQAFETAERKMWAVRETLFTTRGDFAKAMRAETFDTAAVNEAFDKQQAAVDELKASVRGGLQQLHEALTPEQRAQVADLLEYGPHRMGGWRHHGRHGRFGRHSPPHADPVSL
ncbi:MAG: periplasmic heavy metal sensor [Archangium sp.]|nr:periplasmic heavy metal sensor [Archangium sp.]